VVGVVAADALQGSTMASSSSTNTPRAILCMLGNVDEPATHGQALVMV
jgi:hypothetical protein